MTRRKNKKKDKLELEKEIEKIDVEKWCPTFKEIHTYDTEGKIWSEQYEMDFKTFEEHDIILKNIINLNTTYSYNTSLHDIQRLSKTLSYICSYPSLIKFFDTYRKHVIPFFITEAKNMFYSTDFVKKMDEMINLDLNNIELDTRIDDEYSSYDIISGNIQEFFFEMSVLRYTVKKLEKIIEEI